MEEIQQIILQFFLYSFIGWIWETVYCSLKNKRFVYRGFLLGPITPIYGFGILSVLYLLKPFFNNLILLYFLSIILISVLEYATSYILEKLFNATWWDYQDVPLNLNGRVAVPISLFWGLGCIFIVKIVHPQAILLVEQALKTFSFTLPFLLLVIFLIDLIYTVFKLISIKKILVNLMSLSDKQKNVCNKESKIQKNQFITTLTTSKEKALKSLMKNFPNFKWKNVKSIEEFRTLIDEILRGK